MCKCGHDGIQLRRNGNNDECLRRYQHIGSICWRRWLPPVGTGPSWWPQSSPSRHCPDPVAVDSPKWGHEIAISTSEWGIWATKTGVSFSALFSFWNFQTSWSQLKSCRVYGKNWTTETITPQSTPELFDVAFFSKIACKGVIFSKSITLRTCAPREQHRKSQVLKAKVVPQ